MYTNIRHPGSSFGGSHPEQTVYQESCAVQGVWAHPTCYRVTQTTREIKLDRPPWWLRPLLTRLLQGRLRPGNMKWYRGPVRRPPGRDLPLVSFRPLLLAGKLRAGAGGLGCPALFLPPARCRFIWARVCPRKRRQVGLCRARTVPEAFPGGLPLCRPRGLNVRLCAPRPPSPPPGRPASHLKSTADTERPLWYMA